LEQAGPAGYDVPVKYELQTIPVWTAYEQEPDCPLCHLAAGLETDYRDFFLGGAVMAPEVRVEVNRTGFCARHFAGLEAGGNRLGLALMTSTHLAARNERFTAARRELERAAAGGGGRRMKRLTRELSGVLAGEEAGCMICERLERDIANYAYTVISLHREDDEFRETFRASKGFCLPHLRTVLEVAADALRPAALAALTADLFALQDRTTAALTAGLEELAGSYDHRVEGAPGESARQSLPRAISRLVGRRGGV
jgi:hypothetical protein